MKPKNFPIKSLTFVAQIYILKDYYYFLGVSRDASSEEIKKAYRKLSLKYHPDKNENDDYFEKRFREVQEAYDTLIEEESRKRYDFNLGHQKHGARSPLPPYIKSFTASKIRVKKGEEIIIKWQTSNADVVKILPFGLEKSFGERKFKITDFNDGKFHVVLQAMNTLINKSVVQGITITEVFENDKEQIKANVKEFINQTVADAESSTFAAKRKRLFLSLLLLLIALYLLSRAL